MPRVLTEFELMNHNLDNPALLDHFTYEDMGLLSLHTYLFVFSLILSLLLIRDYTKFIVKHDRWMSPHPILILALSAHVASEGFLAVHYWGYSYDGEGYLVLDVFSKVLSGFSEVAITMLLIQMAGGWTLTYADIDVDDSLEIYLPMFALVIMVHIVIAALTFIDVDESHKYHDYAGI